MPRSACAAEHAISVDRSHRPIRVEVRIPAAYAPTSTLALDVYVPAAQPNPYWIGQVSAHLTCEDANIHNKYLGEKPRTGLALGKYHTVTFTMDAQARAQFAKPNRCRFDFTLNTNAGSGTWHLDKLRFQ